MKYLKKYEKFMGIKNISNFDFPFITSKKPKVGDYAVAKVNKRFPNLVHETSIGVIRNISIENNKVWYTIEWGNLDNKEIPWKKRDTADFHKNEIIWSPNIEDIELMLVSQKYNI